MEGLDDFGGDEDAALRYAIALSLQESGNGPPEKPIELSSDEEDGDLDKGPKYPSVTQETKSSPTKPSKEAMPKDTQALSQSPPSTAPPSIFAALGLDRKKMEEERLARMGKRKAPDYESETQGPQQRPRLDISLRNKTSSLQAESTAKVGRHALPYPKGVVKKTWSKGFPRGDDIKIEEVLQKDELELAVISSFQWDDEWMLSKIDCSRTKLLLVAFASNEAQVWALRTSYQTLKLIKYRGIQQKEMKANTPKGAPIKFCFPPMTQTGNMHSKLQLLRYPKYLRIVVPSGNLVPYDVSRRASPQIIIGSSHAQKDDHFRRLHLV